MKEFVNSPVTWALWKDPISLSVTFTLTEPEEVSLKSYNQLEESEVLFAHVLLEMLSFQK